MGTPRKESRHKAEREAAQRERGREREHRRAAGDAGTVTDAPKAAAPPVQPPTPRPTR